MQRLQRQVQTVPEQMGMSSCERKWLSSWVVVSGRRNAERRQYPKGNFAWFHFSYPCFCSKVVAEPFAGLAVCA